MSSLERAPALDLIVNGIAVSRTSMGVRRYYDGIMEQLRWPGKLELTQTPSRRSMERLNEMLQRGRRDAIFWSPAHRGPLRAHNHIVTVHDCINVEYTYKNDWRLAAFRSVTSLTLKGATYIITNSNTTRDSVLSHYHLDERKVIAIPGPTEFGDQIRRWVNRAQLQATQDEPPFVLMVANSLPHKNTALALRAFMASDALRKGIGLKIVGSADSEAINACKASGLQIEIQRGISDETLANWLSRTLFLFSPSLQEGLNLAVAEAVSCGTNVLCSDIPVHREFYLGRAAMCDPHHLGAMVEALNAAFVRSGRWYEATDARPGLSFADVADSYRQLFMQVCEAYAAA